MLASLEVNPPPVKPSNETAKPGQLDCSLVRDPELEPPSSVAPKFLIPKLGDNKCLVLAWIFSFQFVSHKVQKSTLTSL